MKALKTIIATAVIVFALTTVAVAGVQHFTKTPNAEAAGKAPVSYTVTLSAKQLAQLISARSGDQAGATGSTQSATHTARHDARHVHHALRTSQSAAGRHSACRSHHHSHHAHVSGNGRAGDCRDGGGQCADGGDQCGD